MNDKSEKRAAERSKYTLKGYNSNKFKNFQKKKRMKHFSIFNYDKNLFIQSIDNFAIKFA